MIYISSYTTNMIFSDLCRDELNIIFNFLSLKDIWSARLLSKNYDNFINTDFILKSYVHSESNMNIIKKYDRHLEKIIIFGHDNFVDGDLVDMCNLKILDIPKNNKITDSGLIYISDIKELNLFFNRNITDTLARNEHEALLVVD